MKRVVIEPHRFVAVMRWKDGGQTVMEYFDTREACLRWIRKQKQPKRDEFVWCVGEY
jgi:hypothetical protein